MYEITNLSKLIYYSRNFTQSDIHPPFSPIDFLTYLNLLSFIVGNKISSPIVLEHFVVMDDYNKQAKSDINLKKGKIVDVIEKRECGKCIKIKFDLKMVRLLLSNADYLEATFAK